MSISSNRKFEETSFLSKSNSSFIEQMYLKYLNKDIDLPEGWKKYFEGLNEETSIAIKELKGPSWGIKSKHNEQQLENIVFEKKDNGLTDDLCGLGCPASDAKWADNTNKWCDNNPNNHSNNQDCGYIWKLNQGNKYGCWDDTACSNNKQSIIEFDL